MPLKLVVVVAEAPAVVEEAVHHHLHKQPGTAAIGNPTTPCPVRPVWVVVADVVVVVVVVFIILLLKVKPRYLPVLPRSWCPPNLVKRSHW
jgi:hypothetical protein